MEKLAKCPYCGSASGVCSKFKVIGTDYYKFNGMPDGEEERRRKLFAMWRRTVSDVRSSDCTRKQRKPSKN